MDRSFGVITIIVRKFGSMQLQIPVLGSVRVLCKL